MSSSFIFTPLSDPVTNPETFYNYSQSHYHERSFAVLKYYYVCDNCFYRLHCVARENKEEATPSEFSIDVDKLEDEEVAPSKNQF